MLLPLQPTPTSKFLQGYVGAVSSAVSIAVSVSAITDIHCYFSFIHSGHTMEL